MTILRDERTVCAGHSDEFQHSTAFMLTSCLYWLCGIWVKAVHPNHLICFVQVECSIAELVASAISREVRAASLLF